MKDNYTNAGVPHYAPTETPAIRPHEIRKLPDWIIKEKIGKSQALQYIYNWIRNNWKEGDKIIITGKSKKYSTDLLLLNRYDGRTGTFIKLDTKSFPMVRISWDDGGKQLMGPVEFYHHAHNPTEIQEAQ